MPEAPSTIYTTSYLQMLCLQNTILLVGVWEIYWIFNASRYILMLSSSKLAVKIKAGGGGYVWPPAKFFWRAGGVEN